MNLYIAVSIYQIMCCLVHSMGEKKDNKNILILPDFIVTKFPNYIELEEFFDDVYLFRYSLISTDKEKIFEDVEKEMKECMPYSIYDFDHIYNAAMHFPHTLLFVKKEVLFDVFEDSAGVFSRPDALAQSIRYSNPTMYELISSYGLYDASNPYIEKIFINMQAQSIEFQDGRIADFNLTNELTKLSVDTKKKILHIFRADGEIECTTNTCLILTQQFSNLNQMEYEEQVLLYTQIVDLFLKGMNIIIKPHPDDVTDYENYIRRASVIRERFPSELLPLKFQTLPNCILTISSTGIHQLKNTFNQVITFSFLYESTYKRTIEYYVSVLICEKMNIASVFSDKNLLENISSILKSEIVELDKADIVVMDDLQSAKDNFDADYEVSREHEMELFSHLMLNKVPVVFIGNVNLYFEELLELYQQEVRCIRISKGIGESTHIYIFGNTDFITNTKGEFYMENTDLVVKYEELDDKDLEIELLKAKLKIAENTILEMKKDKVKEDLKR